MNNYEIKIKDEAVEDLLNAVEWYEEQQAGLGDKFQHQVVLQISSLKHTPFNNSIHFGDARCMIVKKFPFVIHYAIEESLKTVEVFSIFHTSRNPEIRDKRLK